MLRPSICSMGWHPCALYADCELLIEEPDALSTRFMEESFERSAVEQGEIVTIDQDEGKCLHVCKHVGSPDYTAAGRCDLVMRSSLSASKCDACSVYFARHQMLANFNICILRRNS